MFEIIFYAFFFVFFCFASYLYIGAKSDRPIMDKLLAFLMAFSAGGAFQKLIEVIGG